MSIYKQLFRDPELARRSVLSGLADTVSAILASASTEDRTACETRLNQTLNQFKTVANEINEPDRRAHELFEVVKAEIALGLLAQALETFEMIGPRRTILSPRLGELLYRANAIDEGVNLAATFVGNASSARVGIETLIELFPNEYSKFAEQIYATSDKILSRT